MPGDQAGHRWAMLADAGCCGNHSLPSEGKGERRATQPSLRVVALARSVPTLTVTRPSHYPDRFRACRILVDGQVSGTIGAGQTIDIPVDSSQHDVLEPRLASPRGSWTCRQLTQPGRPSSRQLVQQLGGPSVRGRPAPGFQCSRRAARQVAPPSDEGDGVHAGAGVLV